MSALSYAEAPAGAADRVLLRRRLRRIGVVIAALAFAAAAWVGLGPAPLGGPVAYVVTDGISMLPHIHAGGLVLTRSQNEYRVGEVVAYHNGQLHRVVLHRIIAIHGDRYVFKGDNNNFVDQYQPIAGQLIGREWVYWPNGGKYLNFVRGPAVFAVILGGLGLYAGTSLKPGRSRRRRRHHAR